MKLFFVFIGAILLFITNDLNAQYKANVDTSANVIINKEMALGVKFHSQGWGIRFIHGKNKSVFKRNVWQFELVNMNHLKQVKIINPYYYGSNYYNYAKINSVLILRGSLGRHKQLNRKPYWGGVEVRHFLHYGLNFAIAKPIYYNIIDPETNEYIVDKFDQSKYSDTDIIRKASFIHGIYESSFYPGIHLETGLDFEYGMYKTAVSSLAIGATLDFFPIPIQILPIDPNYFFPTLFINFNIGRRYF